MATFDNRASYTTLVVRETLLLMLYFNPSDVEKIWSCRPLFRPSVNQNASMSGVLTTDHFESRYTSMPTNPSSLQRRASARSEKREVSRTRGDNVSLPNVKSRES